MILLLLQQAFGNEHRHIDILMPQCLEARVKVVLNVLPDRVAVGSDDHTSAHAGVVHKLRLFHHVGIPLRKVHVHRRDLLHHFLVVLSHVKKILSECKKR